MADQKYSKDDEPTGNLHPDASNNIVDAPPIDGPNKPHPGVSCTTQHDGCSDVTIPNDPTWDPEATHHD